MKKVLALIMVAAMIACFAVVTSAAAPSDYIAYFSFDDAESGLAGGQAKAELIGSGAQFADGAITLKDGATYLKVTKKDGTPLLTGVQTLTIAFKAYVEGAPTWPFYVIPDTLPSGTEFQTWPKEIYIGCLLNNNVTVERYNNVEQAARPAAGSAPIPQNEWIDVAAVYDTDKTLIYVNGELVAETPNTEGYDLSLPSILGNNSTFYIGYATWASGEYYVGSLDEFVVYDYALTADQIAALATDGVPGGDAGDTGDTGDNGGTAPQTGFATVALAVAAVASGAYIVSKKRSK
ncbi:MAG TPA: LamG domain-containing protein [Bacillota bacterium]|nr:LamG domain-containing protein [Bacillota bacterium]